MAADSPGAAPVLSASSDDAKLVFGTVFSLRNMVRKLGGDDDAFISYRTGQYKLHFYETPANLRFVMLTDTGSASMRNVLHQIYINLWVEYGMYLRFRQEGRIFIAKLMANLFCYNSRQEPACTSRAQGGRGCQ